MSGTQKVSRSLLGVRNFFGDFNARNKEKTTETEVIANIQHCSTKIPLKSPFRYDFEGSRKAIQAAFLTNGKKSNCARQFVSLSRFFCSVVNLPTHVMIWVAQLGSSQIGLVINRTLIKSR